MAWFKKAGVEWPLWLELTLVITVKVLLIFCLWKAFFSAPVAKHMVVPESLVNQQILGTAAASKPGKVSTVSPSSGQTAPSSCGDSYACR